MYMYSQSTPNTRKQQALFMATSCVRVCMNVCVYACMYNAPRKP